MADKIKTLNKIFKNNLLLQEKFVSDPYKTINTFGTFRFEDSDLFLFTKNYKIICFLDLFLREKYNNSYITARKSLIRLLENRYRLVESDDAFDFKPKEATAKKENINISPGKVLSQKGSINNHLTFFLIESSKNEEIPFKVVAQKYKNTFKYKVKYLDSINFLLFFIYQDGRLFKNSSKRKPNFSIKTSCSKCSQKKVFEQMVSLIKHEFLNSNDLSKEVFDFVELYNMDKFFKLFKINRMVRQYNWFMSTENLKEIYENFDFSFEESQVFVQEFIDEVFKNEEFIKFCLNCDYPDPLNVFKYVFHFLLFEFYYNPKDITGFIDNDTERHTTSFKEIISCSKALTMVVIRQIYEERFTKTDKDISVLNDELTMDFFKSHFQVSYLWELSEYYKDIDLINKYIACPDELDNTFSTDLRYFDYLCDVARKLLPDPIFTKKRK